MQVIDRHLTGEEGFDDGAAHVRPGRTRGRRQKAAGWEQGRGRRASTKVPGILAQLQAVSHGLTRAATARAERRSGRRAWAEEMAAAVEGKG